MIVQLFETTNIGTALDINVERLTLLLIVARWIDRQALDGLVERVLAGLEAR